jgi:hypothetical protein
MATQLFVADVPTTAGKEPTLHKELSAADTFKFVNDGHVVIRISNAAVADTKVTVTPTAKVDGNEVKAREVEVKKEKTQYIGPFPKSQYNDEEEKVSFKLSSAASVLVEVIKQP